MKTIVGASPNHDLVLGRTERGGVEPRQHHGQASSGQKKLRANNVTALHDTRNGPLRRHQGIREARVNGGCQCLSVVPIVWLQVTSFDKRIDLPRAYLDRHQLSSEFSAPAKETNPLRRS